MSDETKVIIAPDWGAFGKKCCCPRRIVEVKCLGDYIYMVTDANDKKDGFGDADVWTGVLPSGSQDFHQFQVNEKIKTAAGRWIVTERTENILDEDGRIITDDNGDPVTKTIWKAYYNLDERYVFDSTGESYVTSSAGNGDDYQKNILSEYFVLKTSVREILSFNGQKLEERESSSSWINEFGTSNSGLYAYFFDSLYFRARKVPDCSVQGQPAEAPLNPEHVSVRITNGNYALVLNGDVYDTVSSYASLIGLTAAVGVQAYYSQLYYNGQKGDLLHQPYGGTSEIKAEYAIGGYNRLVYKHGKLYWTPEDGYTYDVGITNYGAARRKSKTEYEGSLPYRTTKTTTSYEMDTSDGHFLSEDFLLTISVVDYYYDPIERRYVSVLDKTGTMVSQYGVIAGRYSLATLEEYTGGDGDPDRHTKTYFDAGEIADTAPGAAVIVDITETHAATYNGLYYMNGSAIGNPTIPAFGYGADLILCGNYTTVAARSPGNGNVALYRGNNLANQYISCCCSGAEIAVIGGDQIAVGGAIVEPSHHGFSGMARYDCCGSIAVAYVWYGEPYKQETSLCAVSPDGRFHELSSESNFTHYSPSALCCSGSRAFRFDMEDGLLRVYSTSFGLLEYDAYFSIQ